MGNTFSVKKDSIYISLSAPSYSAGQWVDGNILLNIVQQRPAKSLDIAITGREFASITDRVRDRSLASEHPQHIMHNLHNRTENYFLNVSYPLLSLNTGMIEAGQFTIPFRFQLPNQLPQSFNASGSGWTANVVYKIKVTLISSDNSGGVNSSSSSQTRYFQKAGSQEIECVRELVVNANIGHRSDLTQAVTESLDEDILTCFCWPSGILRQSISINKGAYTPGETMHINASIENNSRTAISDVSVLMSRIITLNIQGAIYVFRENLHNQSYPGYPASTRLIGQNSAKMTFALPRQIPPDTSGSVIDCKTTVEFISNPEGCFSNPIKCRIPITLLSHAIFSPEERAYVIDGQTYPEWAPTVVDPVSLGSVPLSSSSNSQSTPPYSETSANNLSYFQSTSSSMNVFSAPTVPRSVGYGHHYIQPTTNSTVGSQYPSSAPGGELDEYSTHPGKF